MQSVTLHQPRIAWDAALVLIRAVEAGGTTYAECRDRFVRVFGVLVGSEIEATRRRLIDPAAPANRAHVEQGLWRVRLEDYLRWHPELADGVLAQIVERKA
jgi:hypothetical protein